jgi:outer membrane protein assembly factor BamB
VAVGRIGALALRHPIMPTMNSIQHLSIGLILSMVLGAWPGLGHAADPAPTSWTSFRGPTGQGHAGSAKIPLAWSESKNVKWKTAVPGRAWSSPVVLGDQIWFTNAPEKGHKLSLVCLSAKTGKKVHDVLLFDIAKHEKSGNDLNSYASPTPVLEEGRVYAHFGRDGTAAVDTKTGKVLWKRENIQIKHMEGAGSSPRLVGDLLILTLDGTDEQFLIGLNKSDGETVWKTKRSPDMKKYPFYARKAYTTPLLMKASGRTELISGGAQCAMSYDPATGKELWRVQWKSGWSNGTTPASYEDLVYVYTGIGKGNVRQLLAIRAGGTGDVTQSRIVWKYKRVKALRVSPLVADGQVHLVSDTGILTVLNAKTGKHIYTHRVGGEFSSAPLFANGHIYLFDDDGKTTVYLPGSSFKVVAENKLDEGFMAGPAVIGNTLFVRTKTHVYRIEK